MHSIAQTAACFLVVVGMFLLCLWIASLLFDVKETVRTSTPPEDEDIYFGPDL